MDLTQIAETLLTAISPAFPVFKSGAEAFSKKVGEQLGEKFQGLWRRIFASKPVGQAVARLGEAPADEEARAALVAQLERLMEYNVELAKELEEWARQRTGAAPVINSVVVTGSGINVATGGSTIVTGDVHGGIRRN